MTLKYQFKPNQIQSGQESPMLPVYSISSWTVDPERIAAIVLGNSYEQLRTKLDRFVLSDPFRVSTPTTTGTHNRSETPRANL